MSSIYTRAFAYSPVFQILPQLALNQFKFAKTFSRGFGVLGFWGFGFLWYFFFWTAAPFGFR